jgi:hypothetical protein
MIQRALACALAVLATACDPEPKRTPDAALDDVTRDTNDASDTGKDTGPDTVEDTDKDTGTDVADSADVGDDAEAPVLIPSARGHVRVRFAGRVVAPRDLPVWLERKDGEGVTAKVRTNEHGDWRVEGPALVKGRWAVCSGDEGLETQCDAPFELVPDWAAVEAPRHVRDAPEGTRGGRVTLADGTPCVWRFPLHGVAVDTVITGEREWRTNASGEFLIFADRAATFTATCEAATASVDPRADTWVEATLPNQPPDVRGLLAYRGDTVIEQRVIGETLAVSVDSDDPDNDRLRARWADNDGPLASSALKLVWQPRATGPELEVLVGDGRGGYDLEPLRLRTTQPPAPSGLLRGPIAGATLTQGDTRVTSQADGSFTLPAWQRDRALVISASGYVDRVVAADHMPAFSLPIDLVPCERQRLDGKAGGLLRLGDALSVTFPGLAFVDADGKPVTANVDVCLALIGPDADDQPLGVLSRDKVRVVSAPKVAWVDVRDAAGVRLAFASDKSAVVSIALSADEIATVGTAQSYTYADGGWHSAGPLKLVGANAELALTAPGAAAGATDDGYGCLRLWLGALHHRANYALRWRTLGPPLGPATLVPITPGLDLLAPLPARRAIRVEVIHLPTNTPVPGWTRVVNSGDVSRQPADLLGVRMPYDLCGADLVLPPPRPVTGVDFLSRVSLGAGTAADGTAVSVSDLVGGYYELVDPGDDRTSPANFWRRNGMWNFSGPFTFDSEAVGMRKSEPSLPRHVAVHKQPIPNFGTITALHLGMYEDLPAALAFQALTGSPQPEIPPRMLAMEAWPASSGLPARVRFFAYVGSQRVRFIDLDGAGMKPVPAVCMNCHGGSLPDPDTLATAVRQTGKWPSDALGAHTIPFALDTLDVVQPAVMLPEYRGVNSALLGTPLSAAGRALILGAYGAAAAPLTGTYDNHWVPAGWVDEPALYQDVVAPYCRSCHLQAGPDFVSRDDFRGLADLIESDVCQNRSMPHSPATSVDFWTSSNPYAPGRLEAGLDGVMGWSGLGCDPP